MNKITTAISILALVISVIVGFIALKTSGVSFGAAGNQLIEQYIPYVLYNGGINTNLPIETGDDLTVDGGSATITSSNTATSTLTAGCFQTYATSTASPVKFLLGSSFTSTTTFPSGTNLSAGSGGLVAWDFGNCP